MEVYEDKALVKLGVQERRSSAAIQRSICASSNPLGVSPPRHLLPSAWLGQ